MQRRDSRNWPSRSQDRPKRIPLLSPLHPLSSLPSLFSTDLLTTHISLPTVMSAFSRHMTFCAFPRHPRSSSPWDGHSSISQEHKGTGPVSSHAFNYVAVSPVCPVSRLYLGPERSPVSLTMSQSRRWGRGVAGLCLTPRRGKFTRAGVSVPNSRSPYSIGHRGTFQSSSFQDPVVPILLARRTGTRRERPRHFLIFS